MSRRLVGLVVAGFGVGLALWVFHAKMVVKNAYDLTPKYHAAVSWTEFSGWLFLLAGVCLVLGLVWLAVAEWIGDRPLVEVWRERKEKRRKNAPPQ